MKGQTAVHLFLALALLPGMAFAKNHRCIPTPQDEAGPFYRPDAPVRRQIGEGYLLFGEVRSAAACQPVGGARIEIWMTGPDGHYDDRWRATLFTRADGRYFIASHFPAPYGTRPSHIHLRVTAPGFEELFTQHYPVPGSAEALVNLVLVPSNRPVDKP